MNNKRRGYLYELKAINELKAAGYDAIHSGASLGPFDIWATNGTEFRKIQVKAIKKPRSFCTFNQTNLRIQGTTRLRQRVVGMAGKSRLDKNNLQIGVIS